MKCKLYVLIILALLHVGLASADIHIDIIEEGKIVSFYDQYYVYQLNGSITVSNPSSFSIFNVELPYYLATLDLRSNSNNGSAYMTPSQLFVQSLPANGSVTLDYKILGITTTDLSSNNRSVLANGILSSRPQVYSNLFGTLKKAPLENVSGGGNPRSRLISVEFRNPTNFNYTLEKVEVIKTTQNNPNAEIDKWIFTGEKAQLLALEGWDFDFIDDNAFEGEIYWLSTDIFFEDITLNSTANISRFDQEDVFVLESNVTINDTILEEDIPFLSNRIYLRKLASSTIVNPGSVIDMTVIVNNFQPNALEGTVVDPIPAGFEVVSVDGGSSNSDNVSWDVSISSNTLKRLKYSLKYTDEDSLGLDHFRPALLYYDGETYASQSIPFVRKYIPDERVFVQKKVKFLAGSEVQVTLSVQNLGESDLHNLVIKEHLLTSAEFREITQAPTQRGVWTIEELPQNEIWETSYITDRAHVMNTVPEVFGVSSGSVLQTIILSNLITSSFSTVPTRVIEIVSIGLLGVIAVLYFLPANFFSRIKRRQSRDLRSISKELSHLRSKTHKAPGSLHDAPRNDGVGLHGVDTGQHGSAGQVSKAAAHQNLQHPHRVARHKSLDENMHKIEEYRKKIDPADGSKSLRKKEPEKKKEE